MASSVRFNMSAYRPVTKCAPSPSPVHGLVLPVLIAISNDCKEKTMLVRSVVLFAHIVGMLVLFVGLALEWLSLNSLREPTSVKGWAWASVLRVLPRYIGAAVGLILVSGIYLAARVGVLDSAWVRVSFSAMVFMAILGGPMVRSRMRAILHAGSVYGEDRAVTLRRQASDPLLHASLRTRVAVGLAIIYLMVGKPDLVESVLVVALALGLGVALSVPQLRAQSSVVEG
jgi:hypothetical protein